MNNPPVLEGEIPLEEYVKVRDNPSNRGGKFGESQEIGDCQGKEEVGGSEHFIGRILGVRHLFGAMDYNSVIFI